MDKAWLCSNTLSEKWMVVAFFFPCRNYKMFLSHVFQWIWKVNSVNTNEVMVYFMALKCLLNTDLQLKMLAVKYLPP